MTACSSGAAAALGPPAGVDVVFAILADIMAEMAVGVLVCLGHSVLQRTFFCVHSFMYSCNLEWINDQSNEMSDTEYNV